MVLPCHAISEVCVRVEHGRVAAEALLQPAMARRAITPTRWRCSKVRVSTSLYNGITRLSEIFTSSSGAGRSRTA
jgi:hypothetical protein